MNVVSLEPIVTKQLIKLLKGIQRHFCIDIQIPEGIPLEITQHKIEIDTIVPNVHQAREFNVTTKKDPYSLPFTNEVINTFVGHEVYTFL